MRVSRNSKLVLGLAVLAVCASSTQAALVAHYKFDEASGETNAANQLPTGNGIVQSGVTTGVAGIDGNAYSFPGDLATGYVDMGNATGIFNTFSPANLAGASNAITVSAWIKTSSTALVNSFFSMASTTTGSGNAAYLALTATTTGTPTATNKATGAIRNTTNQEIISASPVNDDVWHQIAYTLDMTSKASALYVDGVSVGTLTVSTTAFPAFNTFRVGQLTRTSPANPFTGLIDDVRIYSHVLTPIEVSDLYTAFVPEPGSLSLLGIAMIGLFASRRRRAV